MKKLLSSIVLFVLFGCDGKDTLVPTGPVTHPSALEAMEKFPTGLAMHTKVITRSCSPTGGVCHNSKEYPDLHTFGNLVAALDKPCNRDKAEEPENVFDGCEPEADELVIMRSPEWKTKIALVGPEELEMTAETFTIFRRIVLAEPAPATYDRVESKVVRGGSTLVELRGYSYDGISPGPGVLVTREGDTEARIVDLFNLEYRTYLELAAVRGGDPNNNGVFGSSAPWTMLAPGYPEESYLVGRITGTVPGTRMPLANAPLTDAEYVAIFCWIETLDDDPAPSDAIDYERCRFAHEPTSYAFR
jgi:hypothetical protein